MNHKCMIVIIAVSYLHGVIEDQSIKLCQVLDMVALNYRVVFLHEASYLLHVEQQLCHLT